jgi:hypothetical protein
METDRCSDSIAIHEMKHDFHGPLDDGNDSTMAMRDSLWVIVLTDGFHHRGTPNVCISSSKV